jgi:DNA-directed RNA polymerase specialized sigma24 family protein
MIKRDAFEKHLQKGELPISKVGTYLQRSVWNDVRQGGVNPVNREFRKFRTFTDKAKGYKPKSLGVKVVHTEDDTYVVDESTPEITYEDQIFWHRVKSQIEKTCKDAGFTSEVCRLKIEGNSVPEIATKLGVSPPEVKSAISRLRKVLKPILGASRD